ncbi:hypothetical protein [Enterococcus xiangfangensis]|uniref:Uncharacterized protein n=1 Tax=Enterococcus xiangfangensis TaxID=1296537 RepID=A0ABU3FB52_9ENTE|nr:hypothetical protein [Enterococcus xiangfangensis]MDT2759889.1 hypothetical protein [Enterococcus xiangfangensis]NBK08937.1 hypothetical protein [Enterococcus asini]
MNTSTDNKIQKFAEEMVRESLSKDQLSYPERMSLKLQELREKTIQNLKPNRQEETDEIAGYVKDYLTQLMTEENLSEEDALNRTIAVFQADRPLSDEEQKNLERQAYYQSIDPQIEESIGLGYASNLFIGIVIGAIIGIFGQILYTGDLIGIVLFLMIGLGLLLGIALGLNKHNRIISQHRMK